MRSKGGPRWMALSRYSFELTILKRNRRTMRAAPCAEESAKFWETLEWQTHEG